MSYVAGAIFAVAITRFKLISDFRSILNDLQAIRTLDKALGDDTSAPRFIETVSKHGYRSIAPVNRPAVVPDGHDATVARLRADFIRVTSAGTGGALLAGVLLGLVYGFVGAAQPSIIDGGAVSLLLVIVLVSDFSAGAAGAGIALSRFIQHLRLHWNVAAGALGGVTLGAFGNMIG